MSSIFDLASKDWLAAEAERLRELVSDGQTVELRELDRRDKVIRIAFGFGDEFWRVEPFYLVNPRERLVERGRLIVEQGQPVRDRGKLAHLAKKIEHIGYRV